MSEKYFLGRQPILDQQQNLVAFELLFRAANVQYANVSDYMHASASVILNALSDFGIQEVLGRHKGFFNVNIDILMSEALELLPKEQVVIELLETIKITDSVIDRCRELKNQGFSLALDDHDYSPDFEPLYDLVDVIKVDILQPRDITIGEMLTKFQGHRLTFLAEKVETSDQYNYCSELGFKLFQGFYFARPVVLKQKRVDVAKITLMKLLNQLMADAEIKEIENSFRQNPNLIYSLLRLVNSVALGLREKVRTLRHAIMVLGQQQLRRWVLLALYACSDNSPVDSPLLELATLRGRMMELLVQKQPAYIHEKDYPERAFMTGILSLIDVLFETPMEEIVDHLNVTEDIRRALLDREGELGTLLVLAEKVEKTDFDGVRPLLDEFHLTLDQLLAAQLETINWTNSMRQYA